MLWIVCGAGRGVGKTRVAQQLCAVLPKAVYAKQGCSARRPDGPPNYFQTGEDVAAFVEQARPRQEHIVLESNEWARAGKGDVCVFIDGVPERTDMRDDVQMLRKQAHLHVSADASIRDWKRFLRGKLPDGTLREKVCDVLMKQKRHLFTGRPEVRVKLWFMEGGMHIFGAGLARLLEQIERRGTLRDAAQSAKMSYRYAWGLIRNAEKHAGQPLINPHAGGIGGGQSILSDYGRRLLSAYQLISESVHILADECFYEPLRAETGKRSADAAETEHAHQAAVQSVEPLRLSTVGAPSRRDPGEVVVETPLTITIAEVGSFTVMCTPSDVEALAVGFVFSEEIISSADDIVDLVSTTDPLAVTMKVEEPGAVAAGRNLIVTSACGFCGQRNVDKFMESMAASGDTLRVAPATLAVVAQQMRTRQELFKRTGGAHAAGIFTARGELIASAEDIGRHNAVDKAIGKCLLAERPMRGCGVVLSGRVSIELVAKAASAGLELMAAVSAPSSLAIEAAERCNITLCGFVRETRATAYTHPRRVRGAE